jgi:transcriptional pleiotropic regulator of transition state genes
MFLLILIGGKYMKTSGIVRNIDELGRLVVPKEMRTSLGIDYNDPVEITIDNDKIILRKHMPFCVFCGSAENLSVFKEKNICDNCKKELTL